MIGVGFLTLPTIGKSNGWIGIIMFVLLAQGTSMVGNMYLVKAFRATNCQSTCYPTIVETILGKVPNPTKKNSNKNSKKLHYIFPKIFFPKKSNKGYSVVIMIFIGLYILSSSTSYYMFAYIFSWALMKDFNWVSLENETLYKYFFILLIFSCQFLLCLKKDITALRYFTLVSAFIITYVAVVIIVDYCYLTDVYSMEFPGIERIEFGFNWGLATSYGLALFSAVNQFAVCNIVAELEKPSSRRLAKTVGWSYVFPVIIYIVVGVFGYLTYGSEIPAIIITRESHSSRSDAPMTIARIRRIFII
jgi:amino acid permease